MNKEQNSYLSHEEIDMVLDKCQLAQFNEYYFPKANIDTSHMPLLGYGATQRINDALSPFKSSYTFSSSSTGVFTAPADYLYLLSLYTTTYSSALGRNIYNAVQVLNEEELIPRLESQVVPVSQDDPICIMNSANAVQLFPDNTVQIGKLFYLRRPAVPKFGYTPSGRTITYVSSAYNSSSNPTGSTQLEWRDSDITSIIIKSLSYFGLSTSSSDVITFAENKNQQNN